MIESMAGWLFTFLEGFLAEQFMNMMEHISYSASAVILAAWCRQFTGNKQEEGQT